MSRNSRRGKSSRGRSDSDSVVGAILLTSVIILAVSGGLQAVIYLGTFIVALWIVLPMIWTGIICKLATNDSSVRIPYMIIVTILVLVAIVAMFEGV